MTSIPETTSYTTIDCTVCRPKQGAVWIVIDTGRGTRSEKLQLSDIHPDDVAEMETADKVRPMKLRILAGVADELGIGTVPEITHADQPAAAPVPAYGDLFGGIEPIRSIG